MSETSKEKTKLNSYIKKLEAEKEENQLTIRTLRNRIDSIELKINNHNNKCPVDNLSNQNGHVDNLNNQSGHADIANRQNEQLIQSVHNKVTNNILRQVDIQISKLDMQDSKVGGEMNSNQVVQTPSSSGISGQLRKHPQTEVKILEPANDSDVIFVREEQLPKTLTGPAIQYLPVPMPSKTDYRSLFPSQIDNSKPPPNYGPIQPYRPPNFRRQAQSSNSAGVNKSTTARGQRESAKKGSGKEGAGPNQYTPTPRGTGAPSSSLSDTVADWREKKESQSFLEETASIIDLK